MVEQQIRRRLARALIPLALCVLSLGLIVVFALRAVREFRRLQQDLKPGTTDVERIRGWMTVPYVARAYDVSPDALFSALGVPPTGNERLSIQQLAAQFERDPVAVRETIQRVILEHQRSGIAPPAGSP